MQPELSVHQSLKIYLVYLVYFVILGLIPLSVGGFFLNLGIKYLLADAPLSNSWKETPRVFIIFFLLIYSFTYLRRRCLYKSFVRTYSDFEIKIATPTFPFDAFIYSFWWQARGQMIITILISCICGGFLKSLRVFSENTLTLLWLLLISLACAYWSAYVIRRTLELYEDHFQIQLKFYEHPFSKKD